MKQICPFTQIKDFNIFSIIQLLMQDLSYTNFFKLLSGLHIRILIIETGIIHNESIETLLCSDEQGYTKKKNNGKTLSLSSYIKKILEENDLKNKILHDPNDKICYFYKKGTRKLYDITKTKELLSKPSVGVHFELVQKYVQSIHETEKILTLKLSYLNSEFIAEY